MSDDTKMRQIALARSVGILGTCLKEAPEFALRRRHRAAGTRS